MTNHPNRSKKGLIITAQGGITFHVHLDGAFLGPMEFGTIDTNHQYVGDDDEIIEAARAQFGVAEDVTATVR